MEGAELAHVRRLEDVKLGRVTGYRNKYLTDRKLGKGCCFWENDLSPQQESVD